MSSRWREIVTLYSWELRSALRDRTIVVNSIVVPLVLYPLILWGMLSGIAFVRGQTNDLASRVVLLGAAPDALVAAFENDPHVELAPAADEADAAARVRTGALDAAVVLEPSGSAPPADLRVRLLYDGSRERSDVARRRAGELLESRRQQVLRQAAQQRGVPAGAWTGFAVEERNTASPREMGAFVLGLMLPIFFIVMVALGCLYPAVDSTAGERERGTWETLMTSAAARRSILVAKYLVVTTLGGLAGLLNLLAMILTMRGVLASMAGGRGGELEFGLAPSAVPVLVACAVLLAGFLAAGMMLLAVFARTFREGQSLVMPFYLASVIPVMFLGTPETRLTLGTALLPVVNVALAAREAIGGSIQPLEMAVAGATTIVLIVVLLRLAGWVLSVENVLAGSYSGSLFSFLRDPRARRPAGRAA